MSLYKLGLYWHGTTNDICLSKLKSTKNCLLYNLAIIQQYSLFTKVNILDNNIKMLQLHAKD